MEETYRRIFSKMGLTFRVVQADSGAIGGTGSREFMVLAETGEDKLAVCPSCDYAANIEVARRGRIDRENPVKTEEVEEVYTPGITSIEEVAKATGVDPHFIIKAVIKKALYESGRSEIVVFFLRGDDQLEETKALNAIGALELVEATPEEAEEVGLVPGFVGPFGLPSHIPYVIDESLKGATELVAGANKKDYHIKGAGLLDANLLGHLNRYRDLAQVREGDPCPHCGAPLKITKGIEVGHIFKLGTVYSEKMNATFLDRDGKARPFIMGCYGIGVSRLIAAAVEQHHDQAGIKWPIQLAPYQVDIIISDIRKEEQREVAERLYTELLRRGVEAILDDRKERFGVKINDFELIGFPIGVIVGRGVKEGKVEIRERRSGEKWEVPIEEGVSKIEELILGGGESQ
jgi:prolyl-tRNA synthetase